MRRTTIAPAGVGMPVPAFPATPIATPQALAQADLAGVAPLPLTGERRAAFEAYVADALHRFGPPGAAVAVVQGGAVVYAQGFGVKKIGGGDPVTADTQFMIGSVTKSMTSTMAATLVDGWLSWDTPITRLLPAFSVADPQLTERLTVADAFCACTGVPGRDADLIFTFQALTPDGVVAQMAGFPLTAPFGERYQYSNQMYAVGGYAAARAAGAAPDDLRGGHEAAMRERVLNPVGMTRSTFAQDDVLGGDDYALPHATDLDGETRPFPLLADEGFVTPVAPAGALWSSARDMARYVQTELGEGVAPDGTRVVSAENLARTRTPRVAIPPPPDTPPVAVEATQHYATGWYGGAYHGQPLISHSGGTLGFAAEVAFLPEADLGVVILTNGGAGAAPFILAVQFRLFELLFDEPPEIDALIRQTLREQGAELAALRARLRPADPAAVAPYVGRYANPALGEVALGLEDGMLVLEAGEVRSELQSLLDEEGQTASYVFVDPPLNRPDVSVTFGEDGAGRPELVVTVPNRPPTGEAATYVFARLEPPAAATPSS